MFFRLLLVVLTSFVCLSLKAQIHNCGVPHNHASSFPEISGVCSNTDQYYTDTNNLRHRPVDTIRLNFHFVQRDDSSGNFQPLGDGISDPWNNGYRIAQFFIDNLNDRYRENDTNMLPPTGTNPVIVPPRLHFVKSNPHDPSDSGVYFHQSSTLYQVQTPMITIWSDSLFWQWDTLAVHGDSVIDVFFVENYNADTSIQSIPRQGVALINSPFSVIISNTWLLHQYFKYFNIDPTRGYWENFGLLSHELAHIFGINHVFDGDPCDGIDINDTLECCARNTFCLFGTDTFFCPNMPTTNNIMNYGGTQSAITPCQLSFINHRLSDPLFASFIRHDYCTITDTNDVVIEADTMGGEVIWSSSRKFHSNLIIKSGTTLRINCRVVMPTAATITVEKGARLILDEGEITSVCGGLWGGIRVEGNPTQSHPAVSFVYNRSAQTIGSYPSDTSHHGVVLILNESEISKSRNRCFDQ